MGEFVALSEAIQDPTKRGPGTPYCQPWVAEQSNAFHPPTRAADSISSGTSSNGSASSAERQEAVATA